MQFLGCPMLGDSGLDHLEVVTCELIPLDDGQERLEAECLELRELPLHLGAEDRFAKLFIRLLRENV